MLRNWVLCLCLVAKYSLVSGFTSSPCENLNTLPISNNQLLSTSSVSSTSLSAKSLKSDDVDNTNASLDRSSFLLKTATILTTTTATAFGLVVDPSWAAKDDLSLKGTKADPKYQACISTCVFECTKPKGDEQKSRAECLPECKQKCATTKEQLMLGTPLKKD